MVNQLELQQQHEVDVNQRSPDPAKFSIDVSEILRILPEQDLQGELATIVTTERDSYTSTELRSADEETTTIATTVRAGTTTTGTTTTTTTLATATGEPPPDEDSTTRLTSEAAILDLNEAAPTTTATIPTMTTSTTTTTTTTTIATPSSTTTPITSTTKLTTTSTTPDGASKPNISDDLSFKLPCDDMYTLNFCLNGGNCFRWAMSNSFSYCVCPDGYVGERCDSKTEDGKQAVQQAVEMSRVESCQRELSARRELSRYAQFGSFSLSQIAFNFTTNIYFLCRSLRAYASHSAGTAAQNGARRLLFPHAHPALNHLRSLRRRLHVPQCSGSATKTTTTTFAQPALFCELLKIAQLSFDLVKRTN